MSSGYRDRLVQVFAFLGGLYFFLEFILPKEIRGFEFGAKHEEIINGFTVLGTMSIGLGLINLLFIHGSKIVFARKGWSNSAALLIGLIAMIVLTSLEWLHDHRNEQASKGLRNLAEFSRVIKSDKEANISERRPFNERVSLLLAAIEKELPVAEGMTLPAAADQTPIADLALAKAGLKDITDRLQALNAAGDEEQQSAMLEEVGVALGQLATAQSGLLQAARKDHFSAKAYTVLFDGLFVALGSAMFSLLGFYIVSAAFRAFRIRNVEAVLMMIAAVLVMLGQIPFYSLISDDLPMIRGWLLSVPNAGAFKAITFGAAIAGLVMAIRIWLSIESRSFLSEGAE